MTQTPPALSISKRLALAFLKAIEERRDTVSCASVANYFLDRAQREGMALTALQVNGLLYYAHGWHLAYLEKPLLNEHFTAWKHGVKPWAFYNDLRRHGSKGISQPFRSGSSVWGIEFAPRLSKEGMELLDHVWKAYHRFGGVQLFHMTTAPDTPWAQVWKQGEVTLSHDLIKTHFQSKKEQICQQRREAALAS